MKNIYTILSEIGIEIPEEKKSDFDKAVIANYKTIAEVEKITTARDNYKSQLETAQTALKKFDGVDVEKMKNTIDTLNIDLQKKETEYQNKIADMEFNSVLEGAISKSGAKNAKAVKALLDLDTLKSSKNQAEDITKALESVKSENDFMFTSDEPFKNPVGDTGNPNIADKKMTLSEAMKFKNEHPDTEISKLI